MLQAGLVEHPSADMVDVLAEDADRTEPLGDVRSLDRVVVDEEHRVGRDGVPSKLRRNLRRLRRRLETEGTLRVERVRSPGALLLEAVLAEAAADGLRRPSLVTSPPSATRWHPEERRLWHAVRYADTIGGRRRRALDRLKGFARERLRR